MRPVTRFFRDLVLATGRPIPSQTVDTVVRPLEEVLVELARAHDPVDEVPLEPILMELVQRLGLTATPVNARIDEALALASADRPVLLLIRRENGAVSMLLIQSESGSWVRVEALEGTTHRNVRLPISRISEEFHLHVTELMAAVRIGSMGTEDVGESRAGVGSSQLSPLARLWRFVQPDRSELWIVAGFALVVGILALATPAAVQALVNFVAFGGLIQPLIILGILMLGILAFSGAIQAFKAYVVEILQRRLFVRVVSDLSVRVPRIKLETYDKAHGPELVNRYFDVMTVQKAGSLLLLDGLDIALQTLVGLTVLGFYHPLLLVFDAILIVAILFILLFVGRGAMGAAIKESTAKYAVADGLEELTRSPILYKMSGAPELARARMTELASNYIENRAKHFAIVFRQILGAIVLYVLASVALLTLGGWLVITEQLTLGQLIAAELIVSVALASFVKFGTKLFSYYDMMAGVSKLGAVYDAPIDEERGESFIGRGPAAAVALRGVTYKFPGGVRVMRDFDLEVAAGEKVAILGGHSSGKSVLADLMCGLREPENGIITFDGVDVREIASDSRRLQVELAKGGETVAGTVIENIRLGRSDISIQDVQDAVERFGLLEELMERHKGLRTRVTATGAPLSRGMLLRMALARAVAGSPRLVVVDGVLDELDGPALQEAIRVLAGPLAPWTLIVMTSRPQIAERIGRMIPMPGPPWSQLVQVNGAADTGEVGL